MSMVLFCCNYANLSISLNAMNHIVSKFKSYRFTFVTDILLSCVVIQVGVAAVHMVPFLTFETLNHSAPHSIIFVPG